MDSASFFSSPLVQLHCNEICRLSTPQRFSNHGLWLHTAVPYTDNWHVNMLAVVFHTGEVAGVEPKFRLWNFHKLRLIHFVSSLPTFTLLCSTALLYYNSIVTRKCLIFRCRRIILLRHRWIVHTIIYRYSESCQAASPALWWGPGFLHEHFLKLKKKTTNAAVIHLFLSCL